MFKYVKKTEAEKMDEIRRLRAEKEKLEANLSYVAMMTDVDIDEEVEEDVEEDVEEV